MIKKLITILNINILKETRGKTWEWCVQFIQKVEINEFTLNNMANNNLTWGIFGGGDKPGLSHKDAIIRLAEAMGVICIHAPEGGPLNAPKIDGNLFTESYLLKKIEKKGLPINLPMFCGGMEKTKTDYGIITERHCYYLWILKLILDLFPDRETPIIEIGAGLGILGYFLDKVGYKNYTIIDLAYSNLLQSYFLYKNLPERKIIFSDTKNPFAKQYENCIKILHSSDFEKIKNAKFGIMINTDSFTEMLIGDADKYINNDCSDLLLSINHEVNDFRVIDISRRKLLYRYPFWLRKGYVEELYSKLT